MRFTIKNTNSYTKLSSEPLDIFDVDLLSHEPLVHDLNLPRRPLVYDSKTTIEDLDLTLMTRIQQLQIYQFLEYVGCFLVVTLNGEGIEPFRS